jgi:hypothetical protein
MILRAIRFVRFQVEEVLLCGVALLRWVSEDEKVEVAMILFSAALPLLAFLGFLLFLTGCLA